MSVVPLMIRLRSWGIRKSPEWSKYIHSTDMTFPPVITWLGKKLPGFSTAHLLSRFGNEALNPSMSNRTSYSPGREEYPSTCYLEFSVTSTFSPLIYSTNHLHHDGIKHIYLTLCAQVAQCKESTCQHRRCRFSPCVGKMPWSRKWQPNPVFLPGESHGQRRLEGYIPWGCKESDTTEYACPL